MNKILSVFTIWILSNKNLLAAEAGMPQLDPTYWASQAFWLIIIFSSIYFLISKIFIPKIKNSIDSRENKIRKDIEEASGLKENAEKKLKEYNEIIENSKNEAKKIIDEERKKLDKDIEIKKKNFNSEIEKELAAVEKEIKNLKKSSISNIEKISKEITTEVIKQIVSTEANQSNVSAIVNDIVKSKVDKYI